MNEDIFDLLKDSVFITSLRFPDSQVNKLKPCELYIKYIGEDAKRSLASLTSADHLKLRYDYIHDTLYFLDFRYLDRIVMDKEYIQYKHLPLPTR